MSRIGHLSRGSVLPGQRDRDVALPNMSGIGHIARLHPDKGAACASGSVAMSKDRWYA
jgi:hypothetical protein